MLSHVDMESRMPASHPIRKVGKVVDQARPKAQFPEGCYTCHFRLALAA